MKILAIKLRAIGDSVIWTSALRRLHDELSAQKARVEGLPPTKSLPESNGIAPEIHLLTYESNRDVFVGLDYVSKFHGLPDKSKLTLIRKLWSLRGENFDWLLGFHATTSLCRWAWLVSAKQMALHHHSWPDRTPLGSINVPGAGRLEDAITRDHRVVEAMMRHLKVRHANDKPSATSTINISNTQFHPPELSKTGLESNRFEVSTSSDSRTQLGPGPVNISSPSKPSIHSQSLDFSQPVTSQTVSSPLATIRTPTSHPTTQLIVTPVEAESAEARVRHAIEIAGGDHTRPRLAFLPGAGHHLRRYPKDLWWPLVLRARDQALVICDSALAREWNLPQECAENKIPLVVTSTLREFITTISRAQAAMANDSGPGHMAVALGLPTTFLFGPGCVGDWHCYDPQKNPVFWAPVDCRSQGPRDQAKFQFCTVDQCEHHTCMRSLQVQLPSV
ncbi:MAG: glycosyltransferase family 9 protein [Bdellovibrionales bacterium]